MWGDTNPQGEVAAVMGTYVLGDLVNGFQTSDAALDFLGNVGADTGARLVEESTDWVPFLNIPDATLDATQDGVEAFDDTPGDNVLYWLSSAAEAPFEAAMDPSEFAPVSYGEDGARFDLTAAAPDDTEFYNDPVGYIFGETGGEPAAGTPTETPETPTTTPEPTPAETSTPTDTPAETPTTTEEGYDSIETLLGDPGNTDVAAFGDALETYRNELGSNFDPGQLYVQEENGEYVLGSDQLSEKYEMPLTSEDGFSNAEAEALADLYQDGHLDEAASDYLENH